MARETNLIRPIDILLVEDNPGDADLVLEALEFSKLHNTVHIVSDGEKAMLFLRRQGPYAKVPRPDLILLDLNLPRKDGREVLAEIKADGDLRIIPVVILTTSKADEDVLKAYQLHANCYIPKPFDFTQLVTIVRSIEAFWLSVVLLPKKEQS
jgi:two-component system, chemotaxis family, response regulator Rcp1